MSRILVIENNPERQLVIKTALECEGYEVVGTTNLGIAWERIMNIHLRPDLIIVCLENIRHADILRIIHKAVLSLPIIVLYRDKRQLSGLIIHRFWRVMEIPFNPARLADEAKKLLSTQTYI